MPSAPLFVILTLAGCLTPLLTYAWLWQLKEWRRDRLSEHLTREGWSRTLLGQIRPTVGVVAVVLAMLLPFWRDAILTVSLILLAAASFLPLARKRQKFPRWTSKALSITGLSFILAILTCVFLAMTLPIMLPLLPALSPLFVAAAWVLFLPVDTFLKHRVLRSAEKLRTSFTNLTVIGITGSVGKTTAKELIGHLLQDKHPLVTPAYMNAEIGVARWLQRSLSGKSTDDRGVLVIEMGAYKRGEIELLAKIAQPTIGVVTAVGDQHLALFGSHEAIAQAKGELIAALPETGRAFLNGDQPLVRSMRERSRAPVTLVGTGGALDLEAYEIDEESNGVRFRVGNDSMWVALRGTHNVSNVLLAIAVAEHIGISRPRIIELLRTFRPPNQTFSVRTERDVTILDDTHNSSSSSIRAATAWARTQPQAQKTLVVAGLIELGEQQAPVERELGGLARTVFQRLVVLDPTSARHFQEGFGNETELYSTRSQPVQAGSLLVCVGRMSQRTIVSLLP